MMKSIGAVLVGLVVLAAISLGTPVIGSMAQVGSPEASPVASPEVALPEPTEAAIDLEGMILDLEATVSAQADDIAALQTQVADLTSAIAVSTAEADTAEVAGPRDVTVVILLRTRPDEVTGSQLGDGCAGTGRWSDLGPQSSITINDANEVVLSTAQFISGAIVFSGDLFRECQLTYVLRDVPAAESYIFHIDSRSRRTVTYQQLEENRWTITLSFGP